LLVMSPPPSTSAIELWVYARFRVCGVGAMPGSEYVTWGGVHFPGKDSSPTTMATWVVSAKGDVNDGQTLRSIFGSKLPTKLQAMSMALMEL
jgi:hypothetical protein